jgi:hypothetical protein
MGKIFLFLVGFGFMLIGSLYIIAYLNLLTIGYNFLEYVKFITSRIECWNFVLGVILIFISTCEGEKKNELYI